MSITKQLTGMRGVYLVSAELSRLGFLAAPTSRSAIGADILATDQGCQRAYSVQVKANARTFGFWLVGAKALTTYSETHIYVLVNIRSRKGTEEIEYYVVPSKVIAEKTVHSYAATKAKSEWFQFNLIDAMPYKDQWLVFGAP
jgi:hypothetical protein